MSGRPRPGRAGRASVGTLLAIARDGDHMDGSWRGDMPAMAHRGHHGGSGEDWPGRSMQMGAMPGMEVRGGAMAMDERAFLAMMVPHHEMALDMARAVIERGSDGQVRAAARRIVAGQRSEVARMRGWYREWYGDEVPVVPMSGAMAMMGMAMDPGAIEAADDPDRVFLAQMVVHHAGAILMADMARAGEPREEVDLLARQIVAAQSREVGEMQRMRERIAPPLG